MMKKFLGNEKSRRPRPEIALEPEITYAKCWSDLPVDDDDD